MAFFAMDLFFLDLADHIEILKVELPLKIEARDHMIVHLYLSWKKLDFKLCNWIIVYKNKEKKLQVSNWYHEGLSKDLRLYSPYHMTAYYHNPYNFCRDDVVKSS